jgi:hypothetical protein
MIDKIFEMIMEEARRRAGPVFPDAAFQVISELNHRVIKAVLQRHVDDIKHITCKFKEREE